MSGVVGQFERYPSPGKTIDGKNRKKELLDELAATCRRVVELEGLIAERMATEAALRKLSADHEVIFDSVPAMIWCKDRHNNFIRVNRAAASALGMSAGEIEGRSAFELFPDEGEKYYQDDLEVITSGEPRIGIVEKMQIAGGEKIWVRTDKIPSRDEEGNVTGVMVFVVDITDIKKADEAVRESEHKFRDLAEKSLVGIYLVQDGIFRYVNSHLAEIHGYTAEELIDKKGPKDLSFPEDWHMIDEKLRKRISDDADSFHYEFRTLTRTGDIRNIEAYGSRSVFRGSPAVVGTLLDVTERKRTEAALRQNEERLDAAVGLLEGLIEAIPNPIFYKDVRRIYRGCNKAFEALMGLSRKRIIGSSVYDLAPRELAEEYEAMDVALLREGGTQVYETLFRYGDGTLHNVIFNKAIFANADGSAGGLVGTIIDITKRKKAEEALLLSEEKYRSIFENAREGLFQTTPDGRYLSANSTLARMYGYDSPEELMETVKDVRTQQYVNPEDRMRLSKLYETQGFVTGFEAEVYKKNGERVWISMNARAVKDSDGKVLYYEGRTEDITEYKKVQESLAESEERYRVAIEHSNDGVSLLKGGLHIYVNRKFMEIFGYTDPGDVIGKHHSLTVHPDDAEMVTGYNRKRERGEPAPAQYEFKGIRKDGTTVFVEVSAAGTRLKGEPATLAQFRDVTERRRLEAQLQTLSVMDELTGLYNRRGFLTLCQQQLKMADRTKESILFLFADLDRMKWINDTLGHKTGDSALAETAGILKRTFRESDIIGRMGGDEFAVLAIGITDETPEVVTARLHDDIEAFNKSGARAYMISLSIGIVRYNPEKPCSLDALMAQADGLMYEEKRKNSGNALSADGGRLAPSGSGVKRGSKAF